MASTTAPPTLDPLLNAGTLGEYTDAVARGAERVVARLAAVDAPLTGVTPGALGDAVAAVDLDAPVELDAALEELDGLYLRDATFFHHPRYLGHLNCPVALPALTAETILSAVNSSLDTWDQSAGATLIERRLVGWTAERLGFGPGADGVFTSGGTQSNLQALLLARDEAGDDLPRLRIFVSDAGHFSVLKAARVLGLGDESVVAISTDEAKRMRPDALHHELERCRVDGHTPMAIVATAGTTDFGSIDPLPALADAAAHHGAWLHVDAAYGCGLLVSRRRPLLDGVERADSVTADFHKAFFQPVSSSAVIVRDGRTLRHATHHADYLNPEGATVPNQVDKSLQTTRRFDALKLWLTLRVLGPDRVGELFDTAVDRAWEGYELLRGDPRFEVVVPPALGTLVFRFRPTKDATPERSDRVNRAAHDALLASGAAFVASTRVQGRLHLKFTLLNPATTLEDVRAVLDLVAGHAEAAA